MASYFVTSIAPGPWFYVTDANPNGVILANRGSLAIRNDAGNASVWINTDGASAWGQIAYIDASGTINWTSASQVLLADNDATALDIGSTGLLNLLRFITTNGAEQIQYNGLQPFTINAGGLNVVSGTVSFPPNTVNVATSASAALSGSVAAQLTLRVAHPGGGVAVDTVLPIRAGGFRVLDAMVVASGAGGAAAAVQVQTGAGVGVSSNLVIDGAVVNGSVVRTNTLLSTTFASGATIRVQGINVPAASNVFITLAPL